MADFSATTGTFENAIKLAGRTDSQQVRHVLESGNLVHADMFPFLTMYGGKAVTAEGNIQEVKGKIKSKSTYTLTPELYDDEVAPTEFRVTADVTGCNVGDTVTVNLDDTSGLQVDDVLNKVDQEYLQLRVATIASTTQITAEVILNSTGGTTMTLHASIKYLEKLGNSQTDGPTARNGTNRKQVNRTVNLQFMIAWAAQGPLQKNLNIYGRNGIMGPGVDFKDEIAKKLVDLNRMREGQAVAGQGTSTGSGTTRRLYSKGLIGWAGSVYNNTSPDGTMTWEDIAKGLIPKARAGGNGMEVYGIAGNDVLSMFTHFQQKQNRVTSPSKEYAHNIQTFEVPGGVLKLIPSEFMNKEARRGQMITFNPNYLTRCYLQNMDLSFDGDLRVLGTDWVDRVAHYVVEGLMSSNPKHICIHTNLLRAG